MKPTPNPKTTTLYYNRMFSQLKKVAHSTEHHKNTSILRIPSAAKRPRVNKNNLTVNTNILNKLDISTYVKKSNVSSYISTPAERNIKMNKNLRTQPNSPLGKIGVDVRKEGEIRFHTEQEVRKVEVVLEYESSIINASFRQSLTIQEMKLELFRQMVVLNKSNLSKLMDLVTFESTEPSLATFIDYWMSQPEQTLDIFSNNNIQTLKLRPLFCEISTKQVTLTDYVIYRCIGMGGFSKVYLSKCRLNGRLCALKFIDKNNVKNSKKFIQNQRTILEVIDHPNIISLYHSFETKNYIVFSLEYCPNNELFQYLKRKKHLGQDQSRSIFKQIVSGIDYLHSKKVLYRDLKLQNILIDAHGRIKITDFGLSKPNCDEGEVTYSYCGSPEYMAPEMLLKLVFVLFRCGHSYELDYYTLGVLLYQLLLGSSPFVAKTKKEIYFGALHNEVSFSKEIPLTKEVKTLLQGLLHKNPAHRIGSLKGIKQIQQHPWVKKEVDVDNPIKGKLFRQYREVDEPSLSWLQAQYQQESTPYQKKFKHIHYENVRLYKQRIQTYFLFEQQAKKLTTKSRTAANSPILTRSPSKTFITKQRTPYAQKLR